VHSPYSPSTEYDNMKLGKSLLSNLCNSGEQLVTYKNYFTLLTELECRLRLL
jgi:hypothetical protein